MLRILIPNLGTGGITFNMVWHGWRQGKGEGKKGNITRGYSAHSGTFCPMADHDLMILSGAGSLA